MSQNFVIMKISIMCSYKWYTVYSWTFFLWVKSKYKEELPYIIVYCIMINTYWVFNFPLLVSLLTRAIICSLFVDQYFFALGHQATVNSLKIEAGFVGLHGDMKSITLIMAGVLVGINTFTSQVKRNLCNKYNC